MAGLTVGGMRGGFTTAVRPITISNANQYVSRPADAAIVLNTPFSIIRTFGKKTFVDPGYFDSQEELDAIFTPEHYPADTAAFVPRNVVVIIVESLGREYIGELNDLGQCGDNYQGYTPFIDQICRHSFTTDWSFANGRKSIDAMPSILSGIPMFVEPFFLTSASLNEVGGLARSLGAKGYQTAFFHGAQNGSMGFQAFSRATGFDAYYGRTEFDADPDFNGENDFDGTWAIWDEPFLQFYGKKMSEMKEPFMTTVFTASSHHPFAIPEQYRDTFPEEGIAMHKCIRYLDHSLRRFFERIGSEPWYERTLFVIAGDHTNLTDQAYYQTDLGYFGSPFILFDPTGTLVAPQRRHAIAQQIDVMPTVLSALHYDEPYVAFGCDLLTTPDQQTWAINYSGGIYQYVEDGYLLQFDGQEPRALYDILGDWYQTHNLKDDPAAQSILNTRLQRTKAIIQSYMQRMVNDSLVIKNPQPTSE
jgi:phosphoglycerol transferase MdoB-like AlkP superfamily enzyme